MRGFSGTLDFASSEKYNALRRMTTFQNLIMTRSTLSEIFLRDLYVDNHICREGEFYTALKLSQRRVHLFDWRVNLENPFIYHHRRKHEKQATPISLISGHSAALVPVLSSNFLRAALQVLPPPQPKPMIF